jgi:hypothetical protein
MSDRLLISGAIVAMVAASLLWYVTGDVRTQVALHNQTTTPAIAGTTTISPPLTIQTTLPTTNTVEIMRTVETTEILL